jgi:hypothetical protein
MPRLSREPTWRRIVRASGFLGQSAPVILAAEVEKGGAQRSRAGLGDAVARPEPGPGEADDPGKPQAGAVLYRGGAAHRGPDQEHLRRSVRVQLHAVLGLLAFGERSGNDLARAAERSIVFMAGAAQFGSR